MSDSTKDENIIIIAMSEEKAKAYIDTLEYVAERLSNMNTAEQVDYECSEDLEEMADIIKKEI